MVPNTPARGTPNGANGSIVKRKSKFDTPASKAHKNHEMSSPGGVLTPRGDTNSGPCVISSSPVRFHLTF
jgi:DNA polymerase alpha subunit B